ncbi:efflux RND transporter periplasmic adaptor subunit, partial [bacterium]|nr:efflux RND transporter periplasmic adaptor subunit [bacterium]
PGLCPICAMELIPVQKEEHNGLGPREIRLSPAARKLAEVQTAPVQRKFVAADIRLVGKIAYDETRLSYITAWVPGRLDRLFVDYTGIPVRKGDHMVYLYSPELLIAQQELLQAVQARENLKKSDLPLIRRASEQTVEAVREKLRLWGLTQDQIHEIEQRGKPTDHITIYAPQAGIVVNKNAVEGMYVQTGTRIYTIADLSRVWVLLNAYESDLPWIRYGQQVEIETEAYPGEVFHGIIAFVDPILDDMTRTVKVRVNLDNTELRLKPDMFVHARVRSRIAATGRVMDPALAGKWISPMHPEIVKDGPGKCDVCGMPLVRAETLGYVSADEPGQAPLVIPATAPLITGRRAVVYVRQPDDTGIYLGREIVLGPRAGDYYLVEDGLSEGEEVVIRGNFKIDSAVQILAQPSMMNPEGAPLPTAHAHGGMPSPTTQMQMQETETPQVPRFESPPAFKAQMADLFRSYYGLQRALSQDDLERAMTATGEFQHELKAVDMKLLDNEPHMAWMKLQSDLSKAAEILAAAEDIVAAREGFALLSEAMIATAHRFGATEDLPILQYHCPMAFDFRGADWLQSKEGVENPYFGEAMFRCGEQTAIWNKGSQE